MDAKDILIASAVIFGSVLLHSIDYYDNNGNLVDLEEISAEEIISGITVVTIDLNELRCLPSLMSLTMYMGTNVCIDALMQSVRNVISSVCAEQ